jgi:hypothetical protein
LSTHRIFIVHGVRSLNEDGSHLQPVADLAACPGERKSLRGLGGSTVIAVEEKEEDRSLFKFWTRLDNTAHLEVQRHA